MQKYQKYFLVSVILLALAMPRWAEATDFDPANVITNEDLRAKDSMSAPAIQKFLAGMPGTLATYQTMADGRDANGDQILNTTMTAAEAFADVANRWSISPKFLLVLVQKEQSLVEDPEPTQKQYDWATGYGVCDNCSLSDPAIQRWKGFYRQINSAAAQFDYYLANPDEFRYQVGETYTIDGGTVTPQNTATAAMYNYTPHLHGNSLFYSIWNRWFAKVFPDGSLVQVPGQAGVWYLQYGTRRPIKSKVALLTRFGSQPILSISSSDLLAYPTGWPISLANYSVVRSPRGQRYLIVDDEKRAILSPTVFKKIGWNPDEVEDVTDQDLQDFFDGNPITENSVYPQGVLAQDSKSGGIYYVEDGNKYPLWSKEIMTTNFPGRQLIKLTPAELEAYPTGEPVKFKDGTLVRSTDYPEVYVVSNGKLRWIPDEATFVDLGYNWKTIITTSQKAVSLHGLGPVLTN